MWTEQPTDSPIRLNRFSPQSAGLVLWYPMCSVESAASAALDHSGNGNNTTTGWTASQNDLRYMPNYCHYGMYTHTSGVTRTMVDNGSLDALTGPISIAFWYRRTGTITAGQYFLGFGSVAGTSGFIVAAAIGNANNLGYFPGTTGLGTLSSNNYVDLGIRAVDTTEHHCITGEGATLKHYVNGLPASITWSGTGTQAQPTAHSTARCFGSFNSGAGPMTNIIVSDVRIYNRALTESEVWALYDPATRFDLWERPALGVWDVWQQPAASGGGGSGLISRGIARQIAQPIARPIAV